MYPGSFQYSAPSSLAEARGLLATLGPDAKVLAGGHSLIPMMKLRLAEPAHLIDLGRIPELSYVREAGGGLAIGAMTTYHQLETSPLVRDRYPALADAASQVADIQVRNKGTIGGSLAHADPGADLPSVMLALEATLTSTGPGGQRTSDADGFFQGPFTTGLEPDEILSEIGLPALPANTGGAYKKFANKASHFAIVGVTAIVTLAGNTCRRVRIGVTGAGANASRARAAEAALEGREATDDNVDRAAAQAGEGIDFLGDIHASEEFRAHLVQVFARRALQEAVARAR
ncbi:MAG: xanthine dehydrogenase family protein subunit M [Dehalococcoidia bacterium]|nr:xanthine dehydrogenase family protein subunit M [Dehalococcoidia bacterium]